MLTYSKWQMMMSTHSVNSVTITKTNKNQKNQFFTWLSPWILVKILAPNPWVQLTLIPPIKEHILIYGIMFFFPYFGATKNTTTRLAAMESEAQTRNPGDKNIFLNSWMVVTDCSSGALRAIMTAPIIQSVHPIQPCKRVSLRNLLPFWTHKKGELFFQHEMW